MTPVYTVALTLAINMIQRLHTETSLLQVVSNMRVFLNFDQSDASGIINRLQQGINQSHKFQSIRPSEAKIGVKKNVGTDRVARDFETHYAALEGHGNPDLTAAVYLLYKLLTTHKDVKKYLETRSEILSHRAKTRR